MNRLRLAGRHLKVTARKLGRAIARRLPDAHVYGGILAIAIGIALMASAVMPAPFGLGAGLLVSGLGLIWIVRYGADPRVRS